MYGCARWSSRYSPGNFGPKRAQAMAMSWALPPAAAVLVLIDCSWQPGRPGPAACAAAPRQGRAAAGGSGWIRPWGRAAAGWRPGAMRCVRPRRRTGPAPSLRSTRVAFWPAAAMAAAVKGVCSAGLASTVLPAARAAAACPQKMASEKFQGLMASTMRSGRCAATWARTSGSSTGRHSGSGRCRAQAVLMVGAADIRPVPQTRRHARPASHSAADA